MAKGDKKKVEKKISQERELAKQREQQVTQAATPIQETASQAYQQAVPQAQQDYADIQNQFKNYQAQLQKAGEEGKGRVNIPSGTFQPITGPGAPALASYTRSPEFGKALAGYGEFAETGGYSPRAIQEMRERGISPIRSMYASAQGNLERQRSLQGGYSPGHVAAISRMTRDMPQQIADQISNVNAGLAQQQAQGRLAGLSGLGGLAGQELQMQQEVNLANQAAQERAAQAQMQVQNLNNQGRFQEAELLQRSELANREVDADRNRQMLGAIQGQAGLYGTTPGMAGLFGQQALQSTGQLADIAGQFGQQGMGLNQQQIQAAQLPSTFQSTLGNIGQIAGMAAPFVAPWMMGGNMMGGQGGAINRQVFDPRQNSMYLGF